MVISIEELEVGDEILICCQTTFKRLRIRVKPAKNKEGSWKNTPCDIRNEGKDKPGWGSNYNYKNPEYNDIFRADLHYRDMWLINRTKI